MDFVGILDCNILIFVPNIAIIKDLKTPRHINVKITWSCGNLNFWWHTFLKILQERDTIEMILKINFRLVISSAVYPLSIYLFRQCLYNNILSLKVQGIFGNLAFTSHWHWESVYSESLSRLKWVIVSAVSHAYVASYSLGYRVPLSSPRLLTISWQKDARAASVRVPSPMRMQILLN